MRIKDKYMIKIINNYFILETNNTSYIFMIDELKHLIHLYYGKKIEVDENALQSLSHNYKYSLGNAISYDKEHNDTFLESMLFEVSTIGKGDIRRPMIEINNVNGNTTNDFLYNSYEVRKFIDYKDLPCSKYNDETETLLIHLKDNEYNIDIDLTYNVFAKENIITRQTFIKNLNNEEITIKKAYSICLDMRNDNYNLKSFHGHWANEMNEYNQKLIIGSYLNGTISGVSSNRCNPFFIVYKDGCLENSGEAYGFNLIYSGNHQEYIEIDSLNNIRIMQGINPETFEYKLKKDEIFEVPEEVMSYSSNGFNVLSHNFHDYIKNHIIDSFFKSFP